MENRQIETYQQTEENKQNVKGRSQALSCARFFSSSNTKYLLAVDVFFPRTANIFPSNFCLPAYHSDETRNVIPVHFAELNFHLNQVYLFDWAHSNVD